MTSDHRVRVAARVLVAFPSSVMFVLAATAVPAEAGQIRITAVSNATVRVMPDAGADAVAHVPLGTEVNEAGPIGLDKTWVRVRLADSTEGWLLASLTRTLDPVWRWPVYDQIITSRLGRKGDGFPARRELVAFVDRVAPEYTNPEGRAAIELARLRAMQSALEAIPFSGARREPYASWLAERVGEVVYDEPGGRWMLANEPIWTLHARHADTSSADEIAWLAATNGLPGECEGYVTCYLDVRNRLQGEYLRREPDGRYAGEAVATIARTADLIAAPSAPRAAWQFDTTRDCREFAASADALVGAVTGTVVANRDTALASLAAVRAICR